MKYSYCLPLTRLQWWRRWLLLAAALAMTACTAVPSADNEARKEIAALKGEIAILKRQVMLLRRQLSRVTDGRSLSRHGGVGSGVSFAGNPVLGNREAKIAMVEFSDYQCPFCRRYHRQTFDLVKRKYVDTGKLLYVYRDLPLPSHRRAPAAAVAANCAGRQGAYWAMQRKLFAQGARLGRSYFVATAKALKLDIKRYESCLGDRKQMNEVMRDMRYGASLGVRGTPAFFIGRIDGNGIVEVTPVVGAQPMSAFSRVIDQALQRTR